MVVNVTRLSQLELWDIIVSVLKTNSIISRKLRDKDYYEYEPNMQSLSFNQLPYIARTNTSTENEKVDINNHTKSKSFVINFVLAMAYDARSNFREYIESILSEIDNAEPTFNDSGYYDTYIDIVDTSIDLIRNKQVVVCEFELECRGIIDNG